MTQDSPHPIHEELKEIFRQALRAESEKERASLIRKGIGKMRAAPDRLFWCPPNLEDELLYFQAVDDAWDYIERKIHGDIRGKGTTEEKKYDPDKGDASPITLWNRRCEKVYRGLQQDQPQFVSIDARTGEAFNIEEVPQPASNQPSVSELLERVRQVLEEDAEGKYKNSYVRKTPPPPITAQQVFLEIYRRCVAGEQWTIQLLAEHFEVKEGTMNSAWSRKLRPLLQEVFNYVV
ncbi:hypothetical protein [Geitlerinema sp. PCC 9228]|uniref:hypothetical protein n=1 Tax=Geitlerinema sp. PCC 9228 TaxID=111611 RepID=UPI000A7455D3|nr:hypothetical protein [Geitlerinema sp. PCC 9228]